MQQQPGEARGAALGPSAAGGRRQGTLVAFDGHAVLSRRRDRRGPHCVERRRRQVVTRCNRQKKNNNRGQEGRNSNRKELVGPPSYYNM